MTDQPGVLTEADVVVIGAGAFGLNVAYACAKLGAGRVVVLDQFEPASQTSPRAAGLFKQMRSDPPMTELARLSIEIVRRFETETGVAMPHVLSGSLLMARTPEHAAMIDEQAEASRVWDVELSAVDSAEARRLCPYLDPTNLLAAYHFPGDLYVEEPATMLAALQTAGKRLGMTVVGNTRVTAIRTRRGVIEAVETPSGAIRTATVVDAAGAWAARVGALAGCRVSVVPVRHQLRITTPIAGIDEGQPVVRIVDAATYVRPARGGLMVGGFEADPLPLDLTTGFSMDQVPLDPSVLDRFVDSVAGSVPDLRNVPAAEERGGLFTMSADGRPLIGPVEPIRGFWTVTGCNGSGFSLSPGIGRALAEWIVGGKPSLDLSSFSPARFGADALAADNLQKAAVWQYANYYTPQSRR